MPNSLLLCTRACQFASGLLFLGVVAFRWLVLLPAFAGEADETWQKLAPLFRKLNALFLASGLLLLLSGFALFWITSSEMSGDSLLDCFTDDTFRTVLFQTQFGTVSQWRLVCALLLFILLTRLTLTRWHTRRQTSPLELLSGLLGALLVVSVAWTGHAAASGGTDFWWRIIPDSFHLLATSIWPTGLLPFVLFLRVVRNHADLTSSPSTRKVVQHFSQLSFITVGVLIVTGMINSYFTVGRFSALLTTDYGKLLSLKLSLFMGMLGIAALNRYRIVPRILFCPNQIGPNHPSPLFHRLQTYVTIELSLAVIIVVVVSILGITPPVH